MYMLPLVLDNSTKVRYSFLTRFREEHYRRLPNFTLYKAKFMPSGRKIISTSLLVSAIVAIGGYFYVSRSAQPNFNFDYREAEKKDIVSSVRVTGVVRPAEEASLAFERSGKILKADVRVGDSVSADEVIAELDAPELSSQVAAASAGIQAAEAQVEQAEEAVDVEKNKLKALKNAASKKYDLKAQEEKVDQMKAGVDIQEALLRASQANLAVSRAQLAKIFLRSPISGIVSDQKAKVGEVAQAGAPLVSIISPADLEIEASVSEIDVRKIKVGQVAVATVDSLGTNSQFKATVSEVSPDREAGGSPSANTYKVKLRFDKKYPELQAGLTANVAINVAERKNANVVSQQAVIFGENAAYVFVSAMNGRIEKRKVEIGSQNDQGEVEITGGLSVGDQILSFQSKR